MPNRLRKISLPDLIYQDFHPSTQQKILFQALLNFLNLGTEQGSPFGAKNDLLELVKVFGGDVLISDRSLLDAYFRDIDAQVFQEVENYYCFRDSRNIVTIEQIINRDRIDRGLSPLPAEGIWALCMYLEEQKRENMKVSLNAVGEWNIIVRPLKIYLRLEDRIEQSCFSTMVYEPGNPGRVLSFAIHIDANAIDKQVSKVIFSALLLEREPSQQSTDGLIWRIPEIITLPNRDFVSKCLEQFCHSVHTKLDFRRNDIARLPNLIAETWIDKIRANKEYLPHHFDLVFDNYLYLVLGYGPRRQQKENDRIHEYSIPYNRDPLWQFPELRLLLPRTPSQISSDGFIIHEGIKFQSKILKLFKTDSVDIIQSPGSLRTLWVYDDHDRLLDYIY
jgi:hypothetical protein